MKIVNYVRRCKSKTGFNTYKTLHAATDNKTFCGKELNEMWFIEPSSGLTPNDVDCKKCRLLYNKGK